MDTVVALENYIKLKNLPEGYKLRLCGGGRLEFETRWLSSGRRYWEQTSRKDIILPIRETFLTVYNTRPDDFETILTQTEQRLQFLYPNDTDFKNLFNDIRSISAPPCAQMCDDVTETAIVMPTTGTNNVIIGQNATAGVSTWNPAPTGLTPATPASDMNLRRRFNNNDNTKGDVIIDFGDSSEDDSPHSGCAIIDDFCTWFRNCCKIND